MNKSSMYNTGEEWHKWRIYLQVYEIFYDGILSKKICFDSLYCTIYDFISYYKPLHFHIFKTNKNDRVH